MEQLSRADLLQYAEQLDQEAAHQGDLAVRDEQSNPFLNQRRAIDAAKLYGAAVGIRIALGVLPPEVRSGVTRRVLLAAEPRSLSSADLSTLDPIIGHIEQGALGPHDLDGQIFSPRVGIGQEGID